MCRGFSFVAKKPQSHSRAVWLHSGKTVRSSPQLMFWWRWSCVRWWATGPSWWWWAWWASSMCRVVFVCCCWWWWLDSCLPANKVLPNLQLSLACSSALLYLQPNCLLGAVGMSTVAEEHAEQRYTRVELENGFKNVFCATIVINSYYFSGSFFVLQLQVYLKG